MPKKGKQGGGGGGGDGQREKAEAQVCTCVCGYRTLRGGGEGGRGGGGDECGTFGWVWVSLSPSPLGRDTSPASPCGVETVWKASGGKRSWFRPTLGGAKGLFLGWPGAIRLTSTSQGACTWLAQTALRQSRVEYQAGYELAGDDAGGPGSGGSGGAGGVLKRLGRYPSTCQHRLLSRR